MPATSTAALILKLTKNNRLDQDDITAIEQLPIQNKHVAADHCFVRDADRRSESCLIIDGFAFRSKFTTNGIRQILSIHIPGEIPDLQSLHLHVMDHDLTALTECTLGFIKHDALRELIRPAAQRISRALARELDRFSYFPRMDSQRWMQARAFSHGAPACRDTQAA